MRALATTAVLVGLLGAGCSAPLPPAEPFGELSVTRSGGVAGVREVLRVRPDGIALVTSPDLAAGRLDPARIASLRRVLGSAAFRREVHDAQRRDRDDRCSDQFGESVEMGSLAMAVVESCGADDGPSTPAFDEVLTLVADARRGHFDAPLLPADVPVVAFRVDRPATASGPASTVVATPDGTVTQHPPGTGPVRAALSDDQRDALALMGDALLAETPTVCTPVDGWTLTVQGGDGREVSGSSCGFGARALDAYTVTGTLERVVAGR